MKQSETPAAVNSSKKLKSIRNSTETKDDIVLLHISILISDNPLRKEIENREVG